jgi:integrase
MIRDLGRRLLHEVLAGRLAGKFTTEELAVAYRQGEPALKALLDESRRRPLTPLRDQWLKLCAAESKAAYAMQIDSFIDCCGGPDKATVADLTTERIAEWLASRTDGRRHRAGRPVTSSNAEAVAARRRRREKALAAAPRPMSDPTRNRYRAAMSVFCTYLVNVAGVLAVHPLGARRLTARPEPEGRMPHLWAAEWQAYCAALAADPMAPAPAVHVARLLRHAGPDVGELLGVERRNGPRVPGIRVADVLVDRRLPRVRLRRTKTPNSPERLVPYDRGYAEELLAYAAACGAGPADELFAGVDRKAFEAAHDRAARAIGRPGLRLKDFRHLAAIAWAQAGVRLERIQEWLGHTTILLTVIYARFAPDDAFDEPAAERAFRLALGQSSA